MGSLFSIAVAPAHLHAVEFEIEALDGLQAIAGLDVLGIAQHADVDGDLKVILLLADKGVVGQGEVEALVSVDAVGRHWTLERQREIEEIYAHVTRLGGLHIDHLKASF